MLLIVVLIVVGLLLLVAETVLLPGITVAGVLSFFAFAAAVWQGFALCGTAGGFITAGTALASAGAALWLSLRYETWSRFALERSIDATSQPDPARKVRPGDRGITVTRLAPMGRVKIGGETFEAKCPDAYLEPHREVEVTGFDNSAIIVTAITTKTTDTL